MTANPANPSFWICGSCSRNHIHGIGAPILPPNGVVATRGSLGDSAGRVLQLGASEQVRTVSHEVRQRAIGLAIWPFRRC